jgi:hypothetical protein
MGADNRSCGYLSQVDTPILQKEQHTIFHSEFILLTDGDLVVNDSDFIKEELNILKNNADIFACGVRLDISNLPIMTFPDSINWIPPIMNEYPDYDEGLTGVHLVMMRTEEFKGFLKYKDRLRVKLRDSEMHRYCYKELRKKWARTKQSAARHLTWDSYQKLEHPYTRIRRSKPFDNTWNHDRYCSYYAYKIGSFTFNDVSQELDL